MLSRMSPPSWSAVVPSGAQEYYETKIGLERGAFLACLQAISTSILTPCDWDLTLVEACEGPGLFSLWRYIAFGSTLYPITVL